MTVLLALKKDLGLAKKDCVRLFATNDPWISPKTTQENETCKRTKKYYDTSVRFQIVFNTGLVYAFNCNVFFTGGFGRTLFCWSRIVRDWGADRSYKELCLQIDSLAKMKNLSSSKRKTLQAYTEVFLGNSKTTFYFWVSNLLLENLKYRLDPQKEERPASIIIHNHPSIHRC